MHKQLSCIPFFAAMLLIICCIVFALTTPPDAQAQDSSISAYITSPYIPVEASGPSQTATSASLTILYTGQPVSGDQLLLRARQFGTEEVWTFIPDGTPGDLELPLKSTADATWTSVSQQLTWHSEMFQGGIDASNNITTLTARRKTGANGNNILVDFRDVTNTSNSTGVLYKRTTNGVSVRSGPIGSLMFNSATNKLWIKEAEGTWTQIN